MKREVINFMTKKQIIVTTIIITAILIIAFFIFNLFTKKETSTEEIVPQLLSSFSSTETQYSLPAFNGTWPAMPKELPLLSIQLNSITDLASELENYCLIDDQYENIFIGSNCSYYFYGQDQYLELTNNTKVDYQSLSLITKEEAVSNIQNFLNIFVPDKNALALTNVAYWSGGPELTKVSSNLATTIQLDYNYAYQSIPILSKTIVSRSSTFFTNATAPIQKAEIPTRTLSYTPQTQKYSLLSLEQALTNIANNQAYLLTISNFTANAEDPSNSPMDITQLSELYLNEVALEYRFDEINLIATPVFHFNGKALDKNGNRINIEIITPAFST